MADNPMRLDWTWCPTHQKRAYVDQPTADVARNRLPDAALMEAYRCTGRREGRWHVGHKTRRIQALDRLTAASGGDA